jgi:hypothetical protein
MRNIIFIFKIFHVIFVKCYYSPSGQYLETGWVNRLSRPLNRFLPGGNRLNQYKNRLNRFWPSRRQSARSLRCQFCSLCCQTARIFAQSTLFSARFYCAVWPETGWTDFGTGWTGFRFSGGRLLPFLCLSLSPLPFSVSFYSRRRPLILLSLSPSLSTPKLSRALTLLEELLEIRSSRRVSTIFLHLVGSSWPNLRIEVLPYVISLYSILRVLDYLLYRSLGTF